MPQIYKDTIVCYSFSKSLSLPGERLGYVLVPKQVTDADAVYAAAAGAGRSLGYVNAPSLFQQVASYCCDMTADISVYERNCTLLTDALREMGYHVAQPGGAFYLFPRSLEPDDMAFSERAKKFDLLLVARQRLRRSRPLPHRLLRPDGDDRTGAAPVQGTGGFLSMNIATAKHPGSAATGRGRCRIRQRSAVPFSEERTGLVDFAEVGFSKPRPSRYQWCTSRRRRGRRPRCRTA